MNWMKPSSSIFSRLSSNGLQPDYRSSGGLLYFGDVVDTEDFPDLRCQRFRNDDLDLLLVFVDEDLFLRHAGRSHVLARGMRLVDIVEISGVSNADEGHLR